MESQYAKMARMYVEGRQPGLRETDIPKEPSKVFTPAPSSQFHESLTRKQKRHANPFRGCKPIGKPNRYAIPQKNRYHKAAKV